MIVGQPDPSVGPLRKHSRRIDDGLQYEAVHFAAVRQIHFLALDDVDRDRVLVLLEIPRLHVLLADFERRDPDEVEECRVVEGVRRGGLSFVLALLPEEA